MRLFGAFLLFGVALVGCGDRPTERAERDLAVGIGEVGGVRFEVTDGLGVLRQAEPGRLVLWASAPAFELVADAGAGATTSWTIELRNLLPGARLEASSSAGEAIIVSESATALPTRKLFQLELPARSRSVLRLVAPGASEGGALRLAALGDIQAGVDRLGDVLTLIAAEPGVELVLGMGDLTRNGADEEMARIERELEALPLPFYAAIGNHDAPDDTPWHGWYGRASQRFVHRGVWFTTVDSAGATVSSQIYDRLEGWLAEGRGRTHVVTMHIPPLDPVGVRNGSFASRAEAGQMLALLAAGEVDLTLYGHVHSYYSFENAGIPAIISGGGGASEEAFGGTGRHYLVVDLDSERGLVSSRMVPVGD
jgi:Icc protein